MSTFQYIFWPVLPLDFRFARLSCSQNIVETDLDGSSVILKEVIIINKPLASFSALCGMNLFYVHFQMSSVIMMKNLLFVLQHCAAVSLWRLYLRSKTRLPSSTPPCTLSSTRSSGKRSCWNDSRTYRNNCNPWIRYSGTSLYTGQVMELWLSCYLVLLSIDSKTR